VDALRFVETHGVVLESGRGARPNLAEAVAGGPIRGSWWGHEKGREVFRATRAVRESEQILVCRLLGGKITYIHRRLWPALVRLSQGLDRKGLAALHEEHTQSGAHRLRTIAFPRWVPAEVQEAARRLSKEEARRQLGEWTTPYLRQRSTG
jgi:hypothetical protein